jgi:uncharacterized repeat protein (TIGR02059 family)
MKRLLIIQIFVFTYVIGHSQIPILLEGQTYVNATSNWKGVEPEHDIPVSLTFRYNSITSVNTVGKMLWAGQDYYDSRAHNNDNSAIYGNKFDWNGTPGAQACHGIMAGYSLNYVIKYNYIDGPYYGIVHEGGYNDGRSMINTGGGISYNIFKNSPIMILTMGQENVNIYNNTFYYGLTATTNGFIWVSSSNGTDTPAPSRNVRIKNNIFYSVGNYSAINIADIESLAGFECDYNVYYWETSSGNLPRFRINGVGYTWAQWRALGYDAHSIIVDPGFPNDTDFTPSERLDGGIELPGFGYGLSGNPQWNVGEPSDTVLQDDRWQVGAVIVSSASGDPIPVLGTSFIENSTPSRVQMTYSLPLANIIPPVSAFSVSVNSSARTVSSVAVSGSSVLLTLATPVAFSDVVTVSYTRPAANQLQTPAGGLAASVSNQPVTNNVAAPAPVYTSSLIENSTPSRVQMTYSLPLANIIPPVSAFSVSVNSSARTVSSVAVSGSSVLLTLATPVAFSDVVTVSYTRPAANQLQTPAGGLAASVSNQPVINNCLAPGNQPPTVNISSPNNGKKYKKNDKIEIEAVAHDPDGSISKVEFKNGSITFAELTTPPYFCTWEASDTGTYWISVIATDDLGATSISSSIEIHIENNNNANSVILDLYPNPNPGFFTIYFSYPFESAEITITIVSVSGNTVFCEQLNEGEDTKQLDINNSIPGTYILLITSANKLIATKTFVKN